MRFFRRRLPLYLVALCCPWAGAGVPARPAAAPASPPPAPPRALKILSDAVLPVPGYLRASDVRWASAGRVFLALGTDGTVEANLEPAGSEPKERIPGRDKPGGQWSAHRIATSSRYLVAAGPSQALSWRWLDSQELSTHAWDGIQAVDVRENRLAIVGALRDEKNRFAPDGAIAWVGSLDKQLSDLQPLLYDVTGPGAHNMDLCIAFQLGAVRFLTDGSLVVVPGVQAGIHLYDPHGRLVQTWDTAALGIDTDCASLSFEQSRRLMARGSERQAWINRRRVLDSLLPLPQGIGFVIRKVENERTRWDLKVLHRDGSIQAYAIPIEGSNSSFTLQGDVRENKLVFLLQEILYSGAGRSLPLPSRLIVAEIPKD